MVLSRGCEKASGTREGSVVWILYVFVLCMGIGQSDRIGCAPVKKHRRGDLPHRGLN